MKLNDIKLLVDKLAVKIGVKDALLPTYGYSKDGAWPHIEIDGDIFHYIVLERGNELRRDSTLNLDQLLYWIFADVTFSMAMDYELVHREKGKDFRRIMFAHQEELLGLLNDEWQVKKVVEHQKILGKHPFDDLASIRVDYIVSLRSKGLAENEIMQMAYEKYPT